MLVKYILPSQILSESTVPQWDRYITNKRSSGNCRDMNASGCRQAGKLFPPAVQPQAESMNHTCSHRFTTGTGMCASGQGLSNTMKESTLMCRFIKPSCSRGAVSAHPRIIKSDILTESRLTTGSPTWLGEHLGKTWMTRYGTAHARKVARMDRRGLQKHRCSTCANRLSISR
jgi:hypothetical protein